MSQSGDVIAQQRMTNPYSSISVCADDVIYLADYVSSVYKLTDGGVMWSHMFKSPDEWHCHAIKVSTANHSDDL